MQLNMTKTQMQSLYFVNTKSLVFEQVLKNCELVGPSMANILITGETGTGKDVIARYIHACSRRSEEKMVTVNCSSYTDTLLESELFGHERGAFTGAVGQRAGRFEQANQGTLFMDEIGDTNLSTQLKLLRTLESKSVERLGSSQHSPTDFRLISATNRNLIEEVHRGRMREDFFYRISTIVIHLPPLRERKEDLPDLIQYFLTQAQEENQKTITKIVPEVEHFLHSYTYPGNLRELKNIIDRMVVLSEEGVISTKGLPVLYNLDKTQPNATKADIFQEILPWKAFKAKSESEYLSWVIEQCDGNVSSAARKLNISSRQLFNKIAEYNLRDSTQHEL